MILEASVLFGAVLGILYAVVAPLTPAENAVECAKVRALYNAPHVF